MVSSMVICGSHWNGVCGRGTKVETPRFTRALRRARRPFSSTRRERSAMAATSASSSVGSPIMK